MQINTETAKRKNINLTINESVLEEAKNLELNMSQEAERGILNAIKLEYEAKWREKNKEAIQAYNHEIDERGLLITPDWLEEGT